MTSKWILTAALFALAACSPVIEEEMNPTPSIRGDFSAVYSEAKRALQGSLHQNSSFLTDNEFFYLQGKIEALRDRFPESGLALEQSFDNGANQTAAFQLPSGQTKARIDRIRSWQICQISYNLSGVEIDLGENNLSLSPFPAYAYTGARSDFNYNAQPPQYDSSPAIVISRAQTQTLLNLFRSQGCRSSREIVIYSILSESTMGSLRTWKSRMNEILADLNGLRRGQGDQNRVPAVSLSRILEKLTAAYQALP